MPLTEVQKFNTCSPTRELGKGSSSKWTLRLFFVFRLPRPTGAVAAISSRSAALLRSIPAERIQTIENEKILLKNPLSRTMMPSLSALAPEQQLIFRVSRQRTDTISVMTLKRKRGRTLKNGKRFHYSARQRQRQRRAKRSYQHLIHHQRSITTTAANSPATFKISPSRKLQFSLLPNTTRLSFMRAIAFLWTFEIHPFDIPLSAPISSKVFCLK